MKAAALLLLLVSSAFAHVISMSTGWATVDGTRLEYIVRMPRYEMTHEQNPERALFDHISFSSGFETGARVSQECRDGPGDANYLCAANYQFSAPVDRLGVDCTFYQITVPNHIHMLHAEKGGKSDQAILDQSFPSATLAFRPPTGAELLIDQSGSGAFRVWTSWAQILLLIAVALASRTRRELIVSASTFLTGECIGTMAILRSGWQPSPRFAEAAAALALAYLALEIVAFPKSTSRWILALCFGAFEGMFFAAFLFDSGYSPLYVLTGAAFGDAAVLALASCSGLLITRLRLPRRFQTALMKVSASALLVTGCVWFFVRLRA